MYRNNREKLLFVSINRMCDCKLFDIQNWKNEIMKAIAIMKRKSLALIP